MLLKGILESAGYDVKTAVDGLEAFTLLRSERFDLLVSDVEMPRLNGFDLTARVRADRAAAPNCRSCWSPRSHRARTASAASTSAPMPTWSRATSTRATCSKRCGGSHERASACSSSTTRPACASCSTHVLELRRAHPGDRHRQRWRRRRSTSWRAAARGPTWCSWTSTCRASTASRPRAASWRRNPLPIVICTAHGGSAGTAGGVPLAWKPAPSPAWRSPWATSDPQFDNARAEPAADRPPHVRGEGGPALAEAAHRRSQSTVGGRRPPVAHGARRASSASARRPAGRPCCRPSSRRCRAISRRPSSSCSTSRAASCPAWWSG